MNEVMKTTSIVDDRCAAIRVGLSTVVVSRTNIAQLRATTKFSMAIRNLSRELGAQAPYQQSRT